MEKENYNQIIFTAVKDNFLSGYFYIPKVAYEGMQGYILNENELNELLNDTINDIIKWDDKGVISWKQEKQKL